MQKNTTKRNRWLTIRMTPDEYLQIEKRTRQATYQTLSEYARKSILGKSAITLYRNQSLDDFVAEMLLLRNELDRIGRDFNQAIQRLNAFDHLTDLQQWILLNEQDKTELLHRIETISTKISEIYKLCSQE